MGDGMWFPKDWHEFIDAFSFKDTEEYYTNGAYLIPKSRAEQALEHYADELFERVLKAIDFEHDGYEIENEFDRGWVSACKELKSDVYGIRA